MVDFWRGALGDALGMVTLSESSGNAGTRFAKPQSGLSRAVIQANRAAIAAEAKRKPAAAARSSAQLRPAHLAALGDAAGTMSTCEQGMHRPRYVALMHHNNRSEANELRRWKLPDLPSARETSTNTNTSGPAKPEPLTTSTAAEELTDLLVTQELEACVLAEANARTVTKLHTHPSDRPVRPAPVDLLLAPPVRFVRASAVCTEMNAGHGPKSVAAAVATAEAAILNHQPIMVALVQAQAHGSAVDEGYDNACAAGAGMEAAKVSARSRHSGVKRAHRRLRAGVWPRWRGQSDWRHMHAHADVRLRDCAIARLPYVRTARQPSRLTPRPSCAVRYDVCVRCAACRPRLHGRAALRQRQVARRGACGCRVVCGGAQRRLRYGRHRNGFSRRCGRLRCRRRERSLRGC